MASKHDSSFSWHQFWAWFVSDNISDNERKETFYHFLKSVELSSMPKTAQKEVLEFAPKYVVDYMINVGYIPKELMYELKKDDYVSIRPLTYKQLLITYKQIDQ